LFLDDVVCLVHVATATCHDLAADFDRAPDNDAVATHTLTVFRPADGAAAGGAHITAFDTFTIHWAITLHAHATRTNSNIHALGRRSAGAESRQSGHSQNSKKLTHCSLTKGCLFGGVNGKGRKVFRLFNARLEL
jgi:hypothetical protein